MSTLLFYGVEFGYSKPNSTKLYVNKIIPEACCNK